MHSHFFHPAAWRCLNFTQYMTGSRYFIEVDKEYQMTFQTASQPLVISIWPNGAPGTEDWTPSEQEGVAPPPYNSRFIRNVCNPTLMAFFPDPSIANGTAVIICPGGAFHALAIDHEGIKVARWLTNRGMTAFILKYRLIKTMERDEDYFKQLMSNMEDPAKMREITEQQGPFALADGQQAVQVVRQRATEWGLLPDRIGMMGFSAGGNVAANVALHHDANSHPDFVAPIYGALIEEMVVPPDAPPLFIAVANDDDLAVDTCLRLYCAWKEAKLPAELHIYAAGGHGFGMNKQGLPVDGWVKCFGDWLQALGFLNSRQ